MDISTLDAESMKTIEEYALLLLVGLASVSSLERYQERALQLGFLEKDEEEYAQCILYDLKRIKNAFTFQMENILERSPITEQDLIKSLKKLHINNAPLATIGNYDKKNKKL